MQSHSSTRTSIEMRRLAQLLNALSPLDRALLRAVYVPMEYEAMEVLYAKGDDTLLEVPLKVPVLRHPGLCEPLANLGGHIVPLQPSQCG